MCTYGTVINKWVKRLAWLSTLDKPITLNSTIDKSLVFDGIVYYGNTSIVVSLLSKHFCGRWRTECSASFRLLNCIYLKWMQERQSDSADKFSPLQEETEFTPHVSFLTKEDSIAYTLPFQKIELEGNGRADA